MRAPLVLSPRECMGGGAGLFPGKWINALKQSRKPWKQCRLSLLPIILHLALASGALTVGAPRFCTTISHVPDSKGGEKQKLWLRDVTFQPAFSWLKRGKMHTAHGVCGPFQRYPRASQALNRTRSAALPSQGQRCALSASSPSWANVNGVTGRVEEPVTASGLSYCTPHGPAGWPSAVPESHKWISPFSSSGPTAEFL